MYPIPDTTPGRYGDGRGGHSLSLLAKSTTTGRVSRTWAQRLRIDGKPVNLGLGSFPVVTLAEARAKARANARGVAQGTDPRAAVTTIPTFRDAVDKVIALHRATWKDGGKSAAQWQASLNTYAMPWLGNKPVDRITTADVMAVLMPIWNDKRETARRVRQRLSAVMKWAVAQGYRDDNPAGDAIGPPYPSTVRTANTDGRWPIAMLPGPCGLSATRALGLLLSWPWSTWR